MGWGHQVEGIVQAKMRLVFGLGRYDGLEKGYYWQKTCYKRLAEIFDFKRRGQMTLMCVWVCIVCVSLFVSEKRGGVCMGCRCVWKLETRNRKDGTRALKPPSLKPNSP